ncbi:MAG: ferrous iron transport protein A [Terriglobia bacterium]
MSELHPGETAEVVRLAGESLRRRRLLELGLVPGTRVSAVRRSPGGEPTAYAIRGAVVALRREDAALVLVRGSRDGSEQ